MRALVRGGHENIPVHVAPQMLLAGIEREVTTAPDRRAEVEPKVVVTRRLHFADLKERTRPQGAVVMRPIEAAVYARGRRRRQMKRRTRVRAELRAKVAPVGFKLINDGGSCAEPDVQFLENVVVNQIDRDALVPAALAGIRIHEPEQIQFRAVRFARRFIRARLRFPWEGARHNPRGIRRLWRTGAGRTRSIGVLPETHQGQATPKSDQSQPETIISHRLGAPAAALCFRLS